MVEDSEQTTFLMNLYPIFFGISCATFSSSRHFRISRKRLETKQHLSNYRKGLFSYSTRDAAKKLHTNEELYSLKDNGAEEKPIIWSVRRSIKINWQLLLFISSSLPSTAFHCLDSSCSRRIIHLSILDALWVAPHYVLLDNTGYVTLITYSKNHVVIANNTKNVLICTRQY